MIYLDYQATTPLAPEARDAMLRWLDGPGEGDGFANPSSTHKAGRAAAAAVEVARDQVAALLPGGGRVFFTSGATEALNWALLRGAEAMPGGVAGLSIEHAASLQCLERLDAAILPVDGAGLALPPDAALIPENGIVATMLVNNEVGTIQPVADFAAAAHAKNSLLLCDAVQGFGRIAIPEGPDLIAVSAHKIHGPKGVGALWVRDGVELEPLMFGGAQEQGMRSGTVSPALCAGFGAAAAVAAERLDKDASHVERLWSLARDMLPEWTINGAESPRYHGNLNIRREGVNGLRLMSDARDVAFSLGSACGSGSGKVSHVLRAMGVSEADARASLRLGWGRYTSEQELRDGLNAIKDAARLQGVN
ncbi:cysteine desulfurase family protein [Sphingopyxis alaskensis]|jgi:cysteine desulfurase|uniref:Cysteine desulfurase n=1 Tax=Sphingopyxis alaskensis (strain DSM 13593 / LMG 18877 / RB2256) TaxID=317655 RepID=Q1GV08_SPHAL|nr:aminotransferase class V-fold PLP-dependent enzyme [Sphingopyxis alaskensis]ABF52514.1 aminotransferase, class V [Sphingopyxis alaskensis RB2256]MCM3420592.1 aminotransferase class V-fold PLP-dependent enzyme [Sphingopyxis alaskensis]